jgi:hypothetical protein
MMGQLADTVALCQHPTKGRSLPYKGQVVVLLPNLYAAVITRFGARPALFLSTKRGTESTHLMVATTWWCAADHQPGDLAHQQFYTVIL